MDLLSRDRFRTNMMTYYILDQQSLTCVTDVHNQKSAHFFLRSKQSERSTDGSLLRKKIQEKICSERLGLEFGEGRDLDEVYGSRAGCDTPRSGGSGDVGVLRAEARGAGSGITAELDAVPDIAVANHSLYYIE